MSTYGVKLVRSDDIALPVHPLGCTQDTFAQWCAERRSEGARLAVDLFSGAGGLSLGLEQAGWTVAVAVDHDPKAVQTHRHNFPGLALSLDLGAEVDRKTLVGLAQSTEIDLVAGGPPCQPFSRAGRSKIRSLVESGMRDAEDTRRELWRAFLDTALDIAPRAIMMENVPDMGLGDDFRVVRTMVDRLERAGYQTDLRLADAWRYGVPQHRQRLILLARKDSEHFTWPRTTESPTTLRESIWDLPRLGDSTGARQMQYRRRPAPSLFVQQMRKDAPEDIVWDHMTRPVRDDDREIFALMSPKTLYSDIPKDLRRYNADTFNDKYNRLGWSELSRSITAHIARDGYWYIHPEELRTLTVREAARLQTFPDRFRFAGTRSDAFRQIGNAVPPMLGSAAASALAPADEAHTQPADLTQDVVGVRRALTEWGRKLRRGSDWHTVPGPSMTAAAAVIGRDVDERVGAARGGRGTARSPRRHPPERGRHHGCAAPGDRSGREEGRRALRSTHPQGQSVARHRPACRRAALHCRRGPLLSGAVRPRPDAAERRVRAHRGARSGHRVRQDKSRHRGTPRPSNAHRRRRRRTLAHGDTAPSRSYRLHRKRPGVR
ncbi:DNA cytosine methyltransferase [Mycolicibacterium farcinogenes]|nr:DNA cytosine methyltransferase [Mycolicibacterium farcinogenes]